MSTAKKSKAPLVPTTSDYKPEELEIMRQAFICACHEHPDMAATEAQRYDLADALVRAYQKPLTQRELIVAAVGKMKEMYPKPSSGTDNEA
jgi:hypothetical protein